MIATRFPAAGIAVLLMVSAISRADTIPVRDDSPPVSEMRAQSTAAACTLEPGPIQTSTSYAWTTPDAFSDLAWLIPRASCAACGPTTGLEIKTVSFRVRWFGACAATAQVSLVGVTGPPECRVPDKTHVLWGPAAYPINGLTSAGVVHTLTLPAGWCVGPDAFVLIHFVGLGACYPSGNSPGITSTSTPCVSCKEYVSTTTSNPTLTDWCTLAPNSLWMQVEADCCGPVGVGPEPGGGGAAIAILDAPSRQVRMRITLPGRGPVELSVYDIVGRKVRSLVNTELDPGDQLVNWDGTSDAGVRLPAGVYRVRLSSGPSHATAAAILLQ